MRVLLAIDGGGTRTRCQAMDAAGRVLGTGEDGPSNHLLAPHERVAGSLAAAIGEALAGAQLSRSEVACVSAGLDGLDGAGTGAEDAARIFHSIGYRDLSLHGDMAIAHAAALARRPGVPHRFSWQGAVLCHCAPVQEAFRARLRELVPDAGIVAPRYEPIMGAYLLGCRALHWNTQ